MRRLQSVFFAAAGFSLLGSAAVAQRPEQAPPPPQVSQTQEAGQVEQSTQMQQMERMDKMATTVTRMAETCEMMMQKEQRAMPYIYGAGITVAALVFTALVLLIILQIQWIKYWSWKLRHLGPSADGHAGRTARTEP